MPKYEKSSNPGHVMYKTIFWHKFGFGIQFLAFTRYERSKPQFVYDRLAVFKSLYLYKRIAIFFFNLSSKQKYLWDNKKKFLSKTFS